MATHEPQSADGPWIQDQICEYDLAMDNLPPEAQHWPLYLRRSMATAAMLKHMADSDPSIVSLGDERIAEITSHLQTLVSEENKKNAEKLATMKKN